MKSVDWNRIRTLYKAYRFRDAYDETETWWEQKALPPGIGVEDLVLSGRLAERLGGILTSRALWKLALAREPDHPHVSLYVRYRFERKSSFYTQLLQYHEHPEIAGADSDTQMNYMAGKVFLLSSLRDFQGAEQALAQARKRFGENDWLTLTEAELEYSRDRWDTAEDLAMRVFDTSPMMYHNLNLLSRIASRQHEIPTLLERFESIRAEVQNYEIAYLHVWYLVAHAERCSGYQKEEALATASLIVDRYDEMVPLADRRTRERLALSRMDLAAAKGDRDTVRRESIRTRSRWHERLAENLQKNPQGKRFIVENNPVWQGRNTCLPCSVSTLRPQVNLQKLTGELTYGGTSVLHCIEWLEREENLKAVPFVASATTICRMAKAGIGFVYLTGGDNWSHAMAAIGVDEATGTLLIHDPSGPRITEVLLDDIKLHEGPYGPQCVAIVSADQVPAVTEIVPEQDRLPYHAYLVFSEQLRLGDESGAAKILREIAERFPDHPFTRRMQAALDIHASRLPEAIEALEKLLSENPANFHIRFDLIMALHRARNTRRQTEMYYDLMHRGSWGEYEATPSRRDPVYVARYADMLGLTGPGLTRASALLRIALRRSPGEAELWHNLGDILWRQGDLEGAWIPLKTASHLAESNEHYARSLADVGCNIGRLQQALDHLESRAKGAGTAKGSGAPWVTWVGVLADFGFPTQAQETLAEALRIHPAEADTLSFALQFQADNGFPGEADALLQRVKDLPDLRKAQYAEARYLQSTGRPNDAIGILEDLLLRSPSDVDAARQLSHLLSGCEGTDTVLARAKNWVEKYPNDEGFEDLLYEILRDQHRNEEADDLLRRRLERNPQDAWAWIELGHAQIRHAGMAEGEVRDQRLAECEKTRENALIVSPPNANRVLLEARHAAEVGNREKAWGRLLDALRIDADRFDALNHAIDMLRESPRENRLQPMRELLQLLRNRGSECTAIPEFFRCWADTLGMDDALDQVREWKAVRTDSKLLARTEVQLLLGGDAGRKAAAEALTLLDGLFERFPQDFSFAVWRAEALGGMNDVAGMRKAYADLLERFPLHLHSRDMLATAMVREGEIDEAIALLRSGVDLQPQERESWRTLANLYDNLERKEDAVDVLSEAVQRMTHDIGLNGYLVELLLDLDRDTEAVSHARQLVHQFENGFYLWFMLASTLERTGLAGSQDEIEDAYRKAIKGNPSLYEAVDGLARFLTVNGRKEEAFEVLAAFPGEEEYAAAIGGRRIWIRAETGNKEEARKEMSALLEVHPDYLWGWYQLMNWLEANNDADDARDALGTIPNEVRHQVDWRVRRVQVLENCGVEETALEEEWDELVADYPANGRVVLTYVDRCMERGRWAGAEESLSTYSAQEPNAPHIQARRVKIHAHQGRKQKAIDLALEIWSRPGWDVEWADETAWAAIAAIGKPRYLWRKCIRHLEANGHLRSWILDRIIQKCPRRCHRRLEKVVRDHPDSNRLLPGLLDAFSDVGRIRRANAIWESLPTEMRQEAALWSCGIRIANVASDSRQSVRRVRERLKGWQERDTVEMWVLANAIHAHTRNMSLTKSRKKPFRKEDREWLESIVHLAEQAMRRLRFDQTVQFVGLSWIQGLLALGHVREAAAAYREFEYVFTSTREDYWTESVTTALGKHLPELITVLEEPRLSLGRIAPVMKSASRTEYAPLAVYGACVSELRDNGEVEDRKARLRMRRSSGSLNPSGNSDRMSWWWWVLIAYFLLKMSSLLVD